MSEQLSFNTSHPFRGSVPDLGKFVALQSSGYRIVEDKKITLSKALAEKILLLHQVPGDRPLSDVHVEKLMGQMMLGLFLYENHIIASAFCKENGLDYRINAQHTCWAAYELEEKNVPVAHGKSRYIRYEADTLDDVRQLYSLYDRLKVRTKSNVIVSTLFDTDEFAGAGQETLKRLSSAFGFWNWETSTERSRHDSNEIAHRMRRDHLPVCLAVLGFVQARGGLCTPDTVAFRRAAVMGAMFETFDAAPQKAVEFWTPVCDGLNLNEKTDPRYKLRVGLQSSSVTSQGVSTKKKVDSETMYRWCVFAWNAWRRGDPMQLLRAPINTPRPRAVRKGAAH